MRFMKDEWILGCLTVNDRYLRESRRRRLHRWRRIH